MCSLTGQLNSHMDVFLDRVLVCLQPPPPELGYSVTAKDLDEEKKEAINKIQKVLETPGE